MSWENVFGAFVGACLGATAVYAFHMLVIDRYWLRRPAAQPRSKPHQKATSGQETLAGNEVTPVLGSTRFSQTFRPPRRTGQQKH